MLRKIAAVCVVVFFSLSAEEHGRFAVQSTVEFLKFSDLISYTGSSVPNYGPSTTIGIRFFPAERFGIDLSTGLLLGTAGKGDSLYRSTMVPEMLRYCIAAGLAIEAFKGTNASLSFLGNFSLLFSKQYDNVYYSSGGVNMSANMYQYYSTVMPSIFLGLEPEFLASSNFAVYSNFGFVIAFVPSTKSAVYSSTYPLDQGLSDDKNGHTCISTNGLCLGMRYYF